jgi:hypothetical protein
LLTGEVVAKEINVLNATPTNAGRLKLLESDPSIEGAEKERGLEFDAKRDSESYSQNEIDDILKMMSGGN